MSYSIRVTDARTGHKLDLARVDTNPEPVAAAARQQTYKIGKRRPRLYSNVEIVELAAAPPPATPAAAAAAAPAPAAAPPAPSPATPAQLDMFSAGLAPVIEPSAGNELVGLAITLPEQCPRCRGNDAVIGAGRGPHKASIICACGHHRGWMSVAAFNFITATIQQFGRPTEPICVNRQQATADVRSPTTATATKGTRNG